MKHELKHVQKVNLVEQRDCWKFRNECRKLVCGLFSKIVERSPLKSDLCRYLSYLTPENLCSKASNVLEDKVQKTVMKISALKIITDDFADKICSEFSDFISFSALLP